MAIAVIPCKSQQKTKFFGFDNDKLSQIEKNWIIFQMHPDFTACEGWIWIPQIKNGFSLNCFSGILITSLNA